MGETCTLRCSFLWVVVLCTIALGVSKETEQMLEGRTLENRTAVQGRVLARFNFDAVCPGLVEDQDWDDLVKNRHVMILFYTSSCAPCEKLKPKWTLLAKQYENSETLVLRSPCERTPRGQAKRSTHASMCTWARGQAKFSFPSVFHGFSPTKDKWISAMTRTNSQQYGGLLKILKVNLHARPVDGSGQMRWMVGEKWDTIHPDGFYIILPASVGGVLLVVAIVFWTRDACATVSSNYCHVEEDAIILALAAAI